jgi:hypothetical protein
MQLHLKFNKRYLVENSTAEIVRIKKKYTIVSFKVQVPIANAGLSFIRTSGVCGCCDVPPVAGEFPPALQEMTSSNNIRKIEYRIQEMTNSNN